MKFLKIVLFLILGFNVNAQIELFQLQWATDSSYVIGALPSGEPIWVHVDSLGIADSIYIQGDSLIVLKKGSGQVYRARIWDENDYSSRFDIPNPQLNDLYGDSQKLYYWDGDSWELLDRDGEIGNEGLLGLQQIATNIIGLTSSSNGFDIKHFVGLNGIQISTNELDTINIGIDTTLFEAGETQYLNPYVVTGDTVGFYLTVAVDTVLFQNTIDTASYCCPPSFSGDTLYIGDNYVELPKENLIGGWGITSTESPDYTWNLIADSSQVATQYDLGLKYTLPSLTNGSVLFSNGTTIAQDNANLFWDNTGKRLLIKDIPITSYAAGQASIGEEAGINSSGATGSYLCGYRAGYAATNALNSNMYGVLAGYYATNAAYSNMFGSYAGYNATNASYSNMFGPSAGNGATNASYSNMFGYYAGNGATNASYSNMFGYYAGNGATGSDNANFFGSFAGSGATNALHSIFIGNSSGINAVSANFSTFLGASAGNGASNASFSTLIGSSVGRTFTDNNIGANNIIIGTNISLPNAAANMMNLGGVLFGTGFYDNIWTDPKIVPTVGGKIGVMTVTPVQTLDITGTTRITGSDGTSTTIMGRDGDGDVSAITASNGITLASNTLKADTSVLATQYDLTTIAPGIDSTYLKSGWGITVDSVGNTYTAKADTSKLATQYDLTQVAGSSKVIDILGSDFTTSATSLQTTALAYTFPTTGTYEVKLYGQYTSSNTLNGILCAYVESGGLTASFVTGSHYVYDRSTTASGSTMAIRGVSALGHVIATGSVNTASSPLTLMSEILVTVSATGTLTFNFASESGSYSATLMAGSSLIVEKLN